MSAVFWGTSDTTIASVGSGVTRYSPVLANAPVLLRTTEAQAQVPVRQAGTLAGLCVRVTAGNRTTACAVTVRKNGADTALTIVPSGVGTYVNDSDTVTVASGDLLSYALVGGTGGTVSYIYVAIGVTATLAAHTTRTGVADDGGIAISGAGTSTYLALGGEGATNATEANVQIKLHGAGTLKNLALYVLTNSRTTVTSVTVRKNGANSGIGLGAGVIAAGGVGLFEDFTSNAIAFADGDLINFRMLCGTGTGTVTVLWMACDLASTGGDVSWHIAGVSGGVANSAPTTRYYPPYGRLASATTESTMQFRPRVIGATATRLGVRLLANTISGAGALTVRFDGADTTQSISVGSGVATGWVEDGTPDAASAAITGTTAEALGFTSAGSGSATINLLLTEITDNTLTANPGAYAVIGSARAVPWSATDNFDSYTVGANLTGLSGGTAWEAAWGTGGTVTGTWIVQISTSPQGGNLVQTTDSNAVHERVLARNANQGIFHCRIRRAALPTSEFAGIRLEMAVSALQLQIRSDGSIRDYTSEILGTYTPGAWLDVRIELDGAGGQYRTSLDGGAFTAWKTSPTVTEIVSIVLHGGFGASTFEIDDIGPAAGAPGAYTLTANPGTYTVTGAAAGLRAARQLAATAGTVAVTGAPAGLRVARRLVADPGVYAVTGAAVTARRASLLTALPGLLAVTGAPARLSASLLATPGVYGSTGAAAALARGRSLTATAGAYAVAGSPAALQRHLRLVATSGLHAVVGADAILFAGGVVAPLSAVAGAYTVTGTPATLQGARRLEATAGTYADTGAPATLQAARTLTATPGAYAITGSPAALRTAWQVVATPGFYPLTGSTAALTASRQLVALPAAYGLAGALATVQPGGVAALEGIAGLYALAGAPATLLAARRLVTEPGTYAVTGALTGLQKGRVLLAESGVYGVEGTPAELRGAHRLTAAPGFYGLAGSSATLVSSLEGLPPAFAFVRFTSETLRGPVWTGETLQATRFASEVMEGSV